MHKIYREVARDEGSAQNYDIWPHGIAMDACLKYNKTCVKCPLSKRQKIAFQDQISLNAGIQGEHSAILSFFIKLPFVIKIFVLSIFEVLLYIFLTKHYNRYLIDWSKYFITFHSSR